MSMRKLFLLPALFLLWSATPALSLSDSPYLAPGAFDSIHLLPPPPAPNSAAQRQDVEGVLQAQKTSSPERVRLAQEDAKVELLRFADVLGPNFAPDKMPIVAAFFRKVGRDTGAPVTMAKDCWERPRPFLADSAVHPPGTMQQDTANRPGAVIANTAPHDASSPCLPVESSPAYSFSYPSGHSTFGAMTAILLANMIPEKRAELFARGWQYGESRVIGGVHFPTDVESGRIEATAMVALMMQNPDFKTDFAAARAELRRSLGLSQ
jgi:acid phosphatase (class A)